MRILIVDDDDLITQALTAVLANEHYAVEVATDGQVAWDLVQAFTYDLILLDVMLPKLDGISLCRQLRQKGYQMPILLLTRKDSSHDKASGLDAGADDYVVKPFNHEELVARIRALLRRGVTTALPVLEWGSLKLDPTTHEVSYNGHPLQLTPKEYALLELLLRNSRRVFSCGVILEHLWSYEETPGEEAVRTHIKGLRQKLKAAGAAADFIETVYGIGYRLKPLEAIASSPTSTKPTELAQKRIMNAVAGVWIRFQDKVKDQVDILEQASLAILQNELSKDLRYQAEREAHKLAGSLGTFGFTEGSQLARQIEHLLQNGKSLRQDSGLRLRQLIGSLRHELQQPASQSDVEMSNPDERPLLLVIDSDRTLTKQLANEAANWGLRTEITTTLSSAKHIMANHHPQVVLLDLGFSENTEDGLKLLAELTTRTPTVPVLVFTKQDSLNERLEVARLGGRAFLSKPIPPAQVLESITQVLQRTDTTVAKVMVVDDDANILAVLRTLLEPWGLKLTTLDDPRRLWETLEACAPDLLILDIEMPHLNGIELCQIVRNDSRWCGLPIVFLTVHRDTTMVNQVFAVGADDFVNKPIVGAELVTRIINRLERIKLLRNMAETDPLTKVSNRHKSTQELEKFIDQAQLCKQPFCLAILDVDNLKQLNQRYGYASGDGVLRQLGQILLQSFRSEDVVARWAGAEFVVGMYGMTRKEGVKRLTEMLEVLRQHEFIAPNNSKFHVTFSGGVAQYPQDGTDLESLYCSANNALSGAKKAGGDRVLPAGSPALDLTVN